MRVRRKRLWITLAIVTIAGVIASRGFDHWVETTELPPLLSASSVVVEDRHGALLRVYTVDGGRWRLGVGADGVDPLFLRMLIAYEDKRFYDHAGVDPIAMTRAVGQAIWNGGVVSGGSTLTMQVARLLEDSGTGRLRGKLRQIRLALALERRLSKPEILRLYLTHAPYGGNIEGIRAASLAWFGKEPRRLTPAQSALLVALPQSPEARRPDRSPGRARAARNRVLTRMHGFGVVNDERLKTALDQPIPRARRPFPSLAPHMADRARADHPLETRHRLTIDATTQRAVENLARHSLTGRHDALSLAIMVADHQTGEVIASVGSTSYGHASARRGYIDMTRALRSPGSTLKPLVYAMAFDRGLAHPETLIHDRPVSFGPYMPRNFDGVFRGELRVAEALQLSLNIPVVLLMDEIGPARFMAGLRKSGARPAVKGEPGLAVALGGLGMRLGDLVTLYAGLARGGETVGLRWRMGDTPAPPTRFISRTAAWQVGHVLAGLRPPGAKAENRLAFKTGTSYGHRDAWAVGYDGRHVVGVWMGRPDGTPVPGAFGGDLAAPIMVEAFGHVKPELAPLPPPPPETLLVSGGNLPLPLQRFRGRHAVFEKPADAPVLTFPPNGARLPLGPDEQLTIKIRDGVPPFTVLTDGTPRATRQYAREIPIPGLGKGFVGISVIDARGISARVSVRID